MTLLIEEAPDLVLRLSIALGAGFANGGCAGKEGAGVKVLLLVLALVAGVRIL